MNKTTSFLIKTLLSCNHRHNSHDTNDIVRMEFKYSSVVDPSKYDDFGLYDSIPLRVSNFGHLADEGSHRARDDWRQVTDRYPETTSCLCPRFHNFISATIPECLPERLAVLGYLSEFGFSYDGATNMSKRQSHHTDLR